MKQILFSLVILLNFACSENVDFLKKNSKESVKFSIDGKTTKISVFNQKEGLKKNGFKVSDDIQSFLDIEYFIKNEPKFQAEIRENLAGFVVFTEKEENKLALSDIYAVLFFTREREVFRTYLFENKKANVLYVSSYTRATNFISSNDIFSIHKIKFDGNGHFYAFLDRNKVKPFSVKNNELQYFLELEKEAETDSVCHSPCDVGEQGRCIVVGGGRDFEGDWMCSSIAQDVEGGCAEEKVLNDLNISDLSMLIKSYEFKYNFLDKTKKGKEYISKYYEISKYINISAMSKDDFTFMYGVIDSTILPICDELVCGKNENSILITGNRFKILLGGIEKLDKLLNNENASKILDSFKNDLALCKGQSVSFVRNFFKG